MLFEREAMRAALAELAAGGVFIGTSSWKYPGWCGTLYDAERYLYRGKFATTRFERDCLKEYAEVFKTVCVDAAFYTFPTPAGMAGLAAQVPPDFRFGFKVTDEITIRRFPNLARFGHRAGLVNPHFLNADLFTERFLGPLEPHRANVGVLMFEFSHFYPVDYAHGRDFVADLDRFLGALPRGWPYAVEIRNASFLHPEYFAALARHQVAHVFNSWGAMPPVGEQIALPDSRTGTVVPARFLLRPGRKYEEAVRMFSPYDRVQEPNEAARDAGAALIIEALKAKLRRPALIYVNNRLEGNALGTIAALVAKVRAARAASSGQ